MRRLLSFVLIVFGSFVFYAGSAMAQKRVALVIGNAAYKNAPALSTPCEDATAVEAARVRSHWRMRSR